MKQSRTQTTNYSYFFYVAFIFLIFLSCTPREASCHIYDENKLNERLCALENIIKIYEHEVWRVCKNDKIIADYACIKNELKKYMTSILFSLCVYTSKK